MRIAVSTETNQGLESRVAQHFGRCPYFALVDVEGLEVTAVQIIENPFYAGHQAGQVPTFIYQNKANVMLSGGMGGRAIDFFRQLGVQAATGARGTVRDAVGRFLGGELSEAAPCSESEEHGHG
jgi:predicted Fe-Mo cluster-binding NifX family protein